MRDLDRIRIRWSWILSIVILLFAVFADTCQGEDSSPANKASVRAGIWGLKFSPDGKMLAAATNNRGKGGPIVIWNVADWQPLVVHFEKTGGLDVAFSPDGKLLAYGTRSPRVGIINVASGMHVREFDTHEKSVFSVAFTPDGESLITASADATIKIWDVATGKLWRSLEEHTNEVDGIAVSPDGKRLLSGGNDKIARLWDLKTGKVLQKFRPSELIVRRVTFSRDGRFHLVSRWDGRVRIRESATGKLRAVIQSGSNCSDMTGDNHLLATTGWGATPFVYRVDLDPASKERQGEIQELIEKFRDDDFEVREAASKRLTEIGISAEPFLREAMKSDDAEIRIRCRRARFLVRSPEPFVKLKGHHGDVEVVSFSRDDKLLATGCRGGDIVVWSVPSFQRVKTLHAPSEMANHEMQ